MVRVFSVAIAILLASVLGLAGCARKEEEPFVPPRIFEPPITVTVDQLCADYASNPMAADARYQGQHLYFSEVEVEEVAGRDYTDRHGEIQYLKESIIVGQVKFELKDFALLQNVEPGFVLNIEGECRGLVGGFILIQDSLVESVKGDLGTPQEVIIY